MAMRSSSKTRSPPQKLDSLPQSAAPRSPSVRGNHYEKIPDIPNQPLNTPLPITKDGVPHPMPYYITQPMVMKIPDARPPWRQASKQAELQLLELWDESSKLQEKVLKELLSDCLNEEIQSICSSYLVGARSKQSEDRQLLMWLQEEVIEPTVKDEVEVTVYEDIWEKAPMLTNSQIDKLHSTYGTQDVENVFLTFLKDHHKRPLNLDEGKSIYSHKYGEVLYHLNKIISKSSLMENYAIRKLQEQFVTQISAQVLFQEGVQYMENEMAELDVEGRVDAPPRTIQL